MPLVFLDTELTRRCPECGSAFQVNYRKSRKRFCDLAVGYLAGRGEPLPPLPWNSDNLSRMVGVDPDRFDRHTAMGDALWTQAIYDRIVYDLAVGGER